MTLFRWLVLAAALIFAGSSFAQKPAEPDTEKALSEKARPGKQAGAGPVLEITRSSQPSCDVQPVMTDEQIARCRRASTGSTARPQKK